MLHIFLWTKGGENTEITVWGNSQDRYFSTIKKGVLSAVVLWLREYFIKVGKEN